MSWAARAEHELRNGRAVTVRPRGHSMSPRIGDGERVELTPLGHEDDLRVDDVVLVRLRGRHLLHRVSALEPGRAQISNQRGHVNGWVSRRQVLGRANNR